jgi:Na+/melibiose symporter-like transporter
VLGFAIGSLGTGIYSITPSVLLLYFMTDTLGVSPSLAALAVALPKFWDVLTDPVMGVISDNTRTRWGRRRPYLLAGAISMSLSFVFLFSVPEFSTPTGSFAYVLVVYVVSATAYTIFAVPYISMPAEMSADPHERTVIMSYRMFFAMCGLLLGSVAAPLLVEWYGGGRQGYASMS